MIITKKNLDLWIENNWNVLLTGKHGVGKTSIVLDAFKRNNLKWLYFSASTMDPWVDFIGVPKEINDETGSYLDLIRPKHFYNDEVEAIFMDEFNRSHKKIRNAVLELIQFKSINGKKFNNLRIVWAAINPEETDDDSISYDVDKIDPAQKDRFHIHIEIPYQCDERYFSNKYGKSNAKAAIEWWNSISDKNKDLISPRRLDYALEVHFKGGNIRHVLPSNVNVTLLNKHLKIGDIDRFIDELKLDPKKAKDWLYNQSNFDMVENKLLEEDNFYFFVPFFNKEKISNYLLSNSKKGEYFRSKFLNNDFLSKNKNLKSIINDILLSHRRDQSIGYKNIQPILEQFAIQKEIPKESVNLKNFLNHLDVSISTKIKYIETNNKQNEQNIIKLIDFYNEKAKSGTYYKEKFISELYNNFSFSISQKICSEITNIIFEILNIFQLNTIKKRENFQNLSSLFVLILKTISDNNYTNSLTVFQLNMKELSDMNKTKLKVCLLGRILLLEDDMDKFIESYEIN